MNIQDVLIANSLEQFNGGFIEAGLTTLDFFFNISPEEVDQILTDIGMLRGHIFKFKKIIDEMARGIENESKLKIIMDRRTAIHTALEEAPDGSVVIISGKGTDPYIMGPHNTKTPWSDAKVVQQEMSALFGEG